MDPKSLPAPFLERMSHLLGSEYPEFLSSYFNPRTNGMRVNSRKIFSGDFLSLAETVPFSLRPVPWARDGFYCDFKSRPGQHPWHSAGVYYLQEPSAMAVVEYLDPQPGEWILDLAAAPGGKSTQIAALLQGTGLLWANEINSGRARILAANLERWGSPNIIISNESPDRLAPRLEEAFDRILLDAPCSGEGMFRKDPDAVREWSPAHVLACAQRQRAILDSAALMLKPGGRLVYSTCTFSPEENEQVLLRFLERHPDFFSLPSPLLHPDFLPSPDLPGAVRLYPHRIEGEGHFVAVLERKSTSFISEKIISEKNANKQFSKTHSSKTIPLPNSPADGLALFQAFTASAISPSSSLLFSPASPSPQTGRLSSYCFFANHLYFNPIPQLPLGGLTIVRPGLHLGTVKPGRFQPGQGLAHFLKPDDALNYFSLGLDDPRLTAYLEGQAIPSDLPDGWTLVGTGSFPLGWGKQVQGVLKNHYPKELRLL